MQQNCMLQSKRSFYEQIVMRMTCCLGALRNEITNKLPQVLTSLCRMVLTLLE